MIWRVPSTKLHAPARERRARVADILQKFPVEKRDPMVLVAG